MKRGKFLNNDNVFRNDIHEKNRHTESGRLIFYQKPQRRMISLCEELETDSCYFLSFPHMIFGITYIKLSERLYRSIDLDVAFLTEYPNDKSDLYYAHLPNVEYFRVCMNQKFDKSLDQLIKIVINSFWTSSYNDDLYDNIEAMSNFERSTFLKRWEKKTRSKPEWVPGKRNLGNYYAGMKLGDWQ